MKSPHRSRWPHIGAIAFGASQIQATCSYSPPPLPTHGQAADTLGEAQAAVGVEAGRGTMASWWNASYLGDPDVSSGWVGAGRLRLGASSNTDVGVVAAAGPEQTLFGAGEFKWRFARFAPPGAEGAPGFHAALLSGLGAGAIQLRGDSGRSPFVAPYAGVLASGGIDIVQMFVGLRLAASEIVGNAQSDLTLYPMLGFGVQVKPSPRFTLFAEGSVSAGITTNDTGDTALLVYPSAGLCFTFDELWSVASPSHD